jgi:hypothetical protein
MRVTNKNTIMDILKVALDIYNDEFYKENLQLEFQADYKKYYLKPSKRSGRADNDLPSIEIFI